MLTEFEDFCCRRVGEIELSLEGNEEYREHDEDFQKTLTHVREEQDKAPQKISVRNTLEYIKGNISRVSIREGYKQGFNDALEIMRGF